MAKRKKRSGRHRSRQRKDRHKKSRKKKGNDKSKKTKRAEEDQYFEERPDTSSKTEREYKARRRKQDIIFVIFVVLLALGMFGGYYLYDIYWDSDEEGIDGDVIEPKDGNNHVPDNGDNHVEPHEIKWYTYNDGLQLSKSENKPVMIDFYFDGCYWCEELDKNTYSDSRVIEKAKSFVSVKVDTHETNAYNGQELAQQYNIQGCPTIVFLDPQGNEVNRIGGYEDAGQFLGDMDEALNKS